MRTGNKTSRLQQWLESIWYGDGKGRLLLMPLSYLYSVINNYQRKTQTQKLEKLACPVIVVGNITVGGTGKTPLTIHIVKLLQKAGYKPAIITRGYGGKAIAWPQSVTANSNASLVGDEAVLMAQRTNVPVYAGPNRLESIQQLLGAHDCNVIVSDDGMQHYKLPRDIQIAVIDGKRQLGNGYCLPAGPLREKKERLNSCDFIVINSIIDDEAEAGIANIIDQNNQFEMTLSGKTLINLSNILSRKEEKPLSDFSGQNAEALTGIGNPQRFYSTLKASGLHISENSFPDHYAFEESDLSFAEDTTVIMTEKDAVKCQSLIGNDKHFWYLPVSATLPNEFDKSLIDKLAKISLSYFAEKSKSETI